MKKSVVASAISALLASASLALAASVPYVNTPMDTVQQTVNSALTSVNTWVAPNGPGALSSNLYVPTVASAVNQVQLTGSATGSPVIVNPGGYAPDTNVTMLLEGRGSGTVNLNGTTAANSTAQFATTTSSVNQFVFTSGATGTAPSLVTGGSAADTNAGMFLAGNGTGVLGLGGTTTTLAGLQIAQTASRVNDFIMTPTATGTAPSFVTGGAGADTNVGMFIAGAGTGPVNIGGTTTTLAGLQVAQTASRVNDVLITPSATGGTTTVVSGGAGSDANAPLAIAAAGTGNLLLGGTTTTLAGLQVAQTASRVNDVVITPAATGTAPSIVTGGAGADANRNLSLQGSGTGIVALGQTICTITGTSPQTCNGQRGIVTTGTLTTAAATDASFTINNSSVTTSSLIECTDQGYSGTLVTNGYPVLMTCVPGTGTITVHITNLHSANALNGTVQIGFVVLN